MEAGINIPGRRRSGGETPVLPERKARRKGGLQCHWLLFLAMSLFTTVSLAAERVYNFHIPRTDAGSGLNMLARQSDTPLLFLNERVRDKQTNRVEGRYTVREALDILLKDTGIRGTINKNGVLTIAADDPGANHGGVKMKKERGFFAKIAALLVAASSAITAGPATAQDTGSNRLEEVIVTAQKRAQSIQDVPIAMQAFSGQQLREDAVKKVDDIIKMAPGLSLNYNNVSNSGITIRGVGTDNFHGNVNRAVGIYYDEAFMSTPYSGALGVFDLDRVEILRGPQNTLFGRNTTGGAIRYITKKPVPGEPLSGYASGTYGRYDEVDFEGAVSVPMGKNAAARIALQTVNRDGPFKNLAPGRVGERLGTVERNSGRVQVAWNPTGDTSVLASFQFGINRGDNLGTKARGMRDPADPTQFCPQLATSADFMHTNSCVDINGHNPSTKSWNTLYNVSSNRGYIDIYGGALSIKHSMDWGEVTSETTYYETKVKIVNELAGMDQLQFVPQQDSTFKDFSQEVRLKSPDNQPLRWLAGVYYFHEDMLQGTQVRRDANGAINPGGEVTAFNILDQKDEDISVYGRLDFDVTNKLTLTGGLRYTNNRKSADSLFGVASTPISVYPAILFMSRKIVLNNTAGSTGPPPPFRLPLLKPKQTLNEIGAHAGVTYHFTPDIMGYASYSRGFKSGGFDTRALAAFSGTAGTPVLPEILNAWEVGFKSNLENDTVRLNAAGYYYLWNDQQVFATINSVPGFFNIPESVSRGVEASVQWRPREDWLLQFSGSYDNTKVTDVGTIQGIDKGVPLRNAPEYSFNGMLSKDFDVMGGDLNLRSNFRYVGKQYDTLQFSDRFLTTRKAQFYVDARAAYNFGPQRQYQIAVYGENLTSEKQCYDRNIQDSPVIITASPVASTVPCKPNIGHPLYGITASVNF
jgi:iron complex outermembrane receptor protein